MNNTSFYKYCPVDQDENFEQEYSLINLFNSEVTFSTRKNFNDLFDSKINFISPDRSQLKKIAGSLPASKRAEFRRLYLGEDWQAKIRKFNDDIEKLFDSYLYYCVTDCETSNLMWSHYASSHAGFCIEWDANMVKAEKVTYQSDIADFKLLDLIKIHCGSMSKDDVGIRIWESLLIKLDEWEYESEYRFQMSHAMDHLISKQGEKFALVKYQPEWIKSIIFGCRTSDKTKSYIKENLPYKVKFKQAYVAKSSIKIRNLE
ncbi:hypothetical protein Shal_0782 [Shewanella halifaxensis HAW-EB4]|uniref:DUF2971 domain-containing protein n=1 Tax=Shewanella halifaxensis (strain HAW-EB4) TaxID=458817 RepID=B0TTL4_SHEHH|nr:DUF2971 domain-containing protein [Shewanella halifaxensis]ABZ75357.1 hypothetical protein Shal_0782 [Shewanella halifaxensis HAW-EB4]